MTMAEQLLSVKGVCSSDFRKIEFRGERIQPACGIYCLTEHIQPNEPARSSVLVAQSSSLKMRALHGRKPPLSVIWKQSLLQLISRQRVDGRWEQKVGYLDRSGSDCGGR